MTNVGDGIVFMEALVWHGCFERSRENILTRRANQGHYSTITQFVKRPWPFPTTGSSARLQAKSLPTIEVAAARYGE
jgi:hypothetical protein